MWLDKRCSCRHCRPQMSILPPKLLQCCFSNNLWYSNLTAQYFTPFPSSVFGMQKWRRLGQFHHVNDINVYLGTQRGKGSPTPKKYAFFVLNNKRQGFPFVKDQKSSTWTDTKRKGLKLTLLVGELSPSVHLGRHWCHSCDKIDQAFPLHSIKRSINWTVGRPRLQHIYKCY